MRVVCRGFIAVLALAPMLWLGCKRESSLPQGHPLPGSASISTCAPGKPGGELTLAFPFSPKTFNPLLAGDSASDFAVRLMFSSLVQMNWSTQEPVPGLAQSWSVSPDGKTWTFKLRSGVRWSDGKLLTADDVVFTWNSVMLDPAINRMSYEVFRINGQPFKISKLDDATVQVVTPEVFAPFLEFFGTVTILPKHHFEAAVREKRFPAQYAVSAPPESIAGSGPFRLKQFKAGQYTLFERNPEYWVADTNHQRLPYFNTVRVLAGGGPSTDVLLFLNGKTDAFENVRPDMFPNFLTVSAKTGFKLIDIGPGADREFFWFNENTNMAANGTPLVNPVKLKWFRNKKFRQAVSCAIDRERIARDVYYGRALPIYAFISSENARWNNTNVARYAYGPARARSLLAEIGISDRGTNGVATDSDGNAIEITFISNLGNPLRAKACQMIVEDLAKVGIKLVYSPMPFELLQEAIDRDFNYECALIGLGGGAADPSSQINVLKSSEPLHQWFPLQKAPSTEWEARIDELMDRQLHTLDFAQRKRAFDEVQAILAEELPMIYTTSPIACSAVRTNVANLRPAVITPYRLTWNIEELFKN